MDCAPAPALQPAGMALPRALTADLFSARGKLAIRLVAMSECDATATCPELPPRDSFAYLVRNKVRVPAIVAWAEGNSFGLLFEEPLADERRRAAFHGGWRRAATARPAAVAATEDTAAIAEEERRPHGVDRAGTVVALAGPSRV